MSFPLSKTFVDRPSSMPIQMYIFMKNPSEKRVGCIIKVNEVGKERLAKGQQLKIGSKVLWKISSSICTVQGISREDLQSIFKISGPRTIMNDGVKEHHYKVKMLVDWIDRIEWPQKAGIAF